MSLLRPLQSDFAPVLMQYLDTSHSELLEVARPLRSSHIFAWAAATQCDFNLFKLAEHLRGDPLCRRALEYEMESDRDFDRLWASIPEVIVTTDFLAFACAQRQDWAYKYVSADIQSDHTFV